MRPSRFIHTRLGKRTAAFSVVALVVGLPAVGLRLLCVGGSCETAAEASSYAPFCSLPDEIRKSVTESTRDGRSGEVLMVAREAGLTGGTAFTERSSLQPQWPSLEGDTSRIPIAMAGAGIVRGGSLPSAAGLDDIGPTISEIMGFDRAHPEVRSGESMSDVVEAAGNRPKVVIVVAWKGVGSTTLTENPASFPNLERLKERGAGTFEATNNSYSSDPAAPLTTLGTGGVPSQHGITGSLLRNERAELVDAWGRGSPINVIATVAEDLDEAFDQEPVVALVGTQDVDKGLIGGGWYVNHDRDLVSMLPEGSSVQAVTEEAKQLLRLTPLAKDSTPDLLAVAQQGPLEELDRELGRLWAAARRAVGDDFALILAGTGSARGTRRSDAAAAASFVSRLPVALSGKRKVVEAVGPGELFLDQEVLTERELSDEVVLDALLEMETPSGQPLFADVFPSVTVTFGRFC